MLKGEGITSRNGEKLQGARSTVEGIIRGDLVTQEEIKKRKESTVKYSFEEETKERSRMKWKGR
jgi:hypothetical protein